jgi:hypothetical protein
MMRSIYADDNSPAAIPDLSNTTFVQGQINSTADAGGEGGVIFDSAMAFWQVWVHGSLSLRLGAELKATCLPVGLLSAKLGVSEPGACQYTVYSYAREMQNQQYDFGERDCGY